MAPPTPHAPQDCRAEAGSGFAVPCLCLSFGLPVIWRQTPAFFPTISPLHQSQRFPDFASRWDHLESFTKWLPSPKHSDLIGLQYTLDTRIFKSSSDDSYRQQSLGPTRLKTYTKSSFYIYSTVLDRAGDGPELSLCTGTRETPVALHKTIHVHNSLF